VELLYAVDPVVSCIATDLPGYAMTINAAAEISAAATVIQFWNTSVNAAVWITVFLVFIVVINFVGVRLYGEVFKQHII
jgi:amino acid transporter